MKRRSHPSGRLRIAWLTLAVLLGFVALAWRTIQGGQGSAHSAAVGGLVPPPGAAAQVHGSRARVGPVDIVKGNDAALDAAWCGRAGGVVPPLGAQASSAAEQAMDDARRVLERDWLSALQAQGSVRARGLALALGLDPASASAPGQLAELAATSQDPALIAWAIRFCDVGTACAAPMPRLWAARDPGNLAPWLAEFERAAAAGERGSLREALYQLGLAQRDDDYSRLALAMLEQVRRTEVPSLRASVEAQQMMGRSMSMARLGPWRALRAHCLDAVAQRDLDEQALCETAMDAIWRLDDSLVGATLASALARHLPHANEALWAARRQQLDVYQALQAEWSGRYIALAEAGQPCAADAQLREHVRALAQRGERAALDAMLQGRDAAKVARGAGARPPAAAPSP